MGLYFVRSSPPRGYQRERQTDRDRERDRERERILTPRQPQIVWKREKGGEGYGATKRERER